MNYSNNPFNIRSGSNWEGLVGSSHGFCEFESIPYAVRCFIYLVKKSYVRRLGRGYTLEDFVNTYCPIGDGDNNPKVYLNFVMNFMRDRYFLVGPDSRPSKFSLHTLYCFASAVCRIESNYILDWFEFFRGYNLYR